MGLDFIVLAHTNPAQVKRLLGRIRPLASAIYLHVDAPEPKRFVDDKVELLRSRPAPRLGFGIVAATIDGLRRFVENPTGSTHVVLLSGADYPIKPDASIQRFFAERPTQSFIGWKPLPRDGWHHEGLSRINRYHLWIRGRRVVIPPLRFAPYRTWRRFPRGLVPFGGSQWWAMSRECAEYVVAYHDRNPQVSRFYRTTLAPDEMFFHTIVLNSPHSEAVQRPLHYIDWRRGGPHVLTVEDLPRLRESPMLFARKFDTTVDRAVLDRLDEYVANMR
jgi:core-2/I-Branching enzyme